MIQHFYFYSFLTYNEHIRKCSKLQIMIVFPNHSFSCELSYQHCGGGICIWKPFSFSDSSHVPRNPSLRIYVAFCILLFREASPPLAQSSGMFSFISWLPRFSVQLALDIIFESFFKIEKCKGNEPHVPLGRRIMFHFEFMVKTETDDSRQLCCVISAP